MTRELRGRRWRSPRPTLLACSAGLLAGLLASCASAPAGRPTGREGWLLYDVGGLSFEAPAAWRARGDTRRITLEAPDGRALLQAWQVEERSAGEAECLAAAEASLARNAGALERVRRHPTTLAGRRAVTQEADRGGWHGWAYAVCAGTVQYRLFFTSASPAPQEAVEVYRTLVGTIRIGGEA